MPQNVSLPDSVVVDDAEGQAVIPITSRFLFVDVAAQRAKQLRRGALPRLDRHAVGHTPHKLERVAMEEVRTGLINYTLPTRAEILGKA
jgi:DNA-directed RNA polymerase subunit K/omega